MNYITSLAFRIPFSKRVAKPSLKPYLIIKNYSWREKTVVLVSFTFFLSKVVKKAINFKFMAYQ